MKKVHVLFLLLSFLFMSCSGKKEIIISSSSSDINYSGRIDLSNDEVASLSWPGSSIKINFEGESISALLSDETGDNYYNVIIDNDSLFVLRPENKKQYYLLASIYLKVLTQLKFLDELIGVVD